MIYLFPKILHIILWDFNFHFPSNFLTLTFLLYPIENHFVLYALSYLLGEIWQRVVVQVNNPGYI